MSDHNVILRLVDVWKSFGKTPVLRGVNLEIRAGQTTVILGPSGCGKSVLLKHLIGLIKPDAGSVFFRQHEISHLNEKHLAPIRRRMGFLFQGAALFDSMTVEENVCFPMVEHHVGTDESRKARAAEVLAMVGLKGLQSRYPEELSGGQKKRVALARAIALNPQVIFYDEPTTGLDPIRADLINELILRLRAALGNTAVVVTHDLISARKVADRILMLHEGNFILDTTPEELDQVRDETVRRFLAGRAASEELAELDTGRLVRDATTALSGEKHE